MKFAFGKKNEKKIFGTYHSGYSKEATELGEGHEKEIAKFMGLSVPTKQATTSTQEIPLHKVIKNRLNEVIHETLCKEFQEYFFEIDETIVQHSNPNKKDDEVKASKVSGYQLVLPKNDCEFNGKKTQGYAIGVPTIYCKGLKTQDTLY